MSTRAIERLLIITFFFFLLIYYTKFWYSGDYVEIYQSYSTGECVTMIVYTSENPTGTRQDCPSELPRHYKHTWVQ